MKVLVTGGLGFIGSNFIRLLKRKGIIEVINVDNMSCGSQPDNEVEGVKLYKADIADFETVSSIIREEKPDVIVNFAAQSHVDRSIVDPLSFVKSNVEGVVSLLESIRRYNEDAKFIQIGTDEEYGEIYEGSFNEESRLKPSSPYSASKASATLFALSYVRTYGLDVIVSRSSNNYGPYQFPEKLIPKTIIRAYLNLPIPIYGKGNNVRDWTFVEDNCEAIYLLIEKGKKGEIYNISANEERTNLEVVKTILRIMNKPESLIKFVEDRPGHDFRYSISSEKIRSLGWMPKYTFEQGIKITVEWYLKNEWWWRKVINEKVISETPWKVKS
ncbi:dTDP-glucose 4,6-dehydratase [Acidianus sulfidivorans JP7]|uniref:dTDP-glucose 4,6-dehydratase n=1 Tax=Acidianus sulfidivorans JP7 TaxID=619593 RepID=A0A2U9IJL7_9CREN|nr:dTDP-glucose 4,6-dehydratase [Acidianus sulfidivorans]AWR96239.1 dTDP-glucose 4,6-dehydratase [Acidianus sulfidivorans JP7]